MNPEPLYTPEQVAEAAQLDVVTIRRLCARGTIRAKKIGNRWRIPQPAYQQWLDNSEPPAGVAPPRRVDQPRSRWHLRAIDGRAA